MNMSTPPQMTGEMRNAQPQSVFGKGWQHFLAGWYKLTAPALLPDIATFSQREAVRRGRLTSSILLTTIVAVLILAVPVIFFTDRAFLPVLLSHLIFSVIALIYNRLGRVNIAGLLVVLGIDVGLAFSLLSATGGLNPGLIPLYDMLVLSELAAASLLPGKSVFVVAVGNILFICSDLLIQHQESSMLQLMSRNAPEIYTRPIAMQIIVAIVLYLWVRSTTQASRRADRAEVVARLEHNLERQNRALAEQKRQLEVGIQQIMQTHIRISRGDLNARVPLNADNVLWSVAGSLNNLLARLQQLRYIEQEFKQTQPRLQYISKMEYELMHSRYEVTKLVEGIRRAKMLQQPFYDDRPPGSLLDPIVAELNGRRIESARTGPLPDTDKLESIHPQVTKKLDNLGWQITKKLDNLD